MLDHNHDQQAQRNNTFRTKSKRIQFEPNPYNLPYTEAIFASTYIPWQHSTRGRRRGALGRGENTIPVAEPRQPNNRDGGAGSRCERDRRGIGLTSVLAEHATQIIDGRRAAGWGERATCARMCGRQGDPGGGVCATTAKSAAEHQPRRAERSVSRVQKARRRQ